MQDLLVRCNAASDLIAALVRSPDRPVALHAAAALQALTDGHAGAQLALQECGGIQVCLLNIAWTCTRAFLQPVAHRELAEISWPLSFAVCTLSEHHRHSVTLPPLAYLSSTR